MKRCMICGHKEEDEKIVHLPIYIIGSEGLDLCHLCEMTVITVIRELRSCCARARIDKAISSKKVR